MVTNLLNPMPAVEDLGVPSNGSVGHTLESNNVV